MDIETRKQNGILTIEFNRPDKKNSITAAMYRMMADAIQDGEEDRAVRVLLLRQTGDFQRATIWRFHEHEERRRGRPVAGSSGI